MYAETPIVDGDRGHFRHPTFEQNIRCTRVGQAVAYTDEFRWRLIGWSDGDLVTKGEDSPVVGEFVGDEIDADDILDTPADFAVWELVVELPLSELVDIGTAGHDLAERSADQDLIEGWKVAITHVRNVLLNVPCIELKED